MGDWLNNLKAGDEVIIRSGFIRDTRRLARVDKATDKQVVVGQTRFWKKNGVSVGSDAYSRETLEEATPELRANVLREREKARLVAALEAVSWRSLDLETLKRVYEALKSAGGKAE